MFSIRLSEAKENRISSITAFVNTVCVFLKLKAFKKKHLDYLSRLSWNSLPHKVKRVEHKVKRVELITKNPWRPSRGGTAQPFTEIHHSNQPFVVGLLDDQRNANECRHCRVEFPRRQQIVPFDIILSHQEKWMYLSSTPDPKTKLPSAKFITKYYCVKRGRLYYIALSLFPFKLH